MTEIAPNRSPEEKRRAQRRYRFFSSLWLVYLVNPVMTVVHRLPEQPVAGALGLAGFAAFVGLYVGLAPMAWVRLPDVRQRYLLVAVLFVLATALLPLTGETGVRSYVFVIAAAWLQLPTRAALGVVAVVTSLAAGLSAALPSWTENPVAAAYELLITAVAVGGFARLIRTINELRVAREELARLAVAEERSRFARDMHDVLGHSLTVITVKAELARRLVSKDPAQAEHEVADIERLARTALGDVRATVAGYRQVSLPTELASARSVLAAAGISADLPSATDAVPAEHRDLFAWVVREGVTNVVRHSRARTCTVRLTPTSVEVRDDGQGPQPDGRSPAGGKGSGLAGLAERVAAAGGTLEAGPEPRGGFRLRVTVRATRAPSPVPLPRPSEAPA